MLGSLRENGKVRTRDIPTRRYSSAIFSHFPGERGLVSSQNDRPRAGRRGEERNFALQANPKKFRKMRGREFFSEIAGDRGSDLDVSQKGEIVMESSALRPLSEK